MRTANPSLIAVICVGLLLGAAVTAIAAPAARDTHAKDGDHRAEASDGNDTSSNDTASDRAAVRAARHAALTSYHENRSAVIRELNETLHSIKAAFLAAKADVIEACKAEKNETNTSGNASEVRKCVQTGLKPLIEQARADIQEAREDAREQLLELRTASIKGFREAKARVAEHRAAREA